MAEKITQEQLAAVDQLNQKLKDTEISAKQYADALKEAGLELAQQLRLLQDKQSKLEEINKAQGESVEITERLKEVDKEIQDLLKGIGKESKKSLDGQSEALKQLKEDLKNANVWGASFLSNMADGIPIMEQLQAAAAGAVEQFAGDTALLFVTQLGLGVKNADALTTKFNAVTGTAGAMNGVLLNSAAGMGAVGVSTEMAAEAATALYQEFNQFSSANTALQTDMVQTAASLERLGVGAAVTAKNIDLASNAFGMGVSEATQLQDELAKTAMAIGMPPAQLAQEFGKAAPQLSAYGKEGIKIFKNMAAASKGLGIEMGTLLGLTERFDTFEGAAESAGRLNAMLGGDLLNSMDLLNASEDERIRMILQSVEASGKSWQSMGKFERKALANAAGITDMAEANKLFGGGLSAFDDAQAKMAENAKTEEELAAAKAASVSVTEKLSLLMDRFTAAMAPVVDALHFVLNGVLAINDSFGGYLIPVLMGGVAAFYALYKVMQAVAFYDRIMTALKAGNTVATALNTAAQTSQAGAQGAVAATAGPAALGTQAMGVAAFAAAPGVAALALGLGGLAIGIGLVAVSIAGIVWAFVTLIGMLMEAPMAAVYAAGSFVVLGAAVAGLALIMAAIAPLAPLAMASMVMLGIGMMFMAVPMLLLASSMYIFGAALRAGGFDPVGIALLGGSLALFAITLSYASPLLMAAALLFAPAAILIGFGLVLLGAGVALLSQYSSELPELGENLSSFAGGLIGATIKMGIAAFGFAPAAILVGTGLTLLGIGVSLLADYASSLPTLGAGLEVFADGLRGSAISMGLAALSFAPSAIAIGLGLMMMGIGVGMIVEYRRSMRTLGKNLPAFALSLSLAAPMLAAAGLALMVAGPSLLIGAITLAPAIFFLSLIPADTMMLASKSLAEAAPYLMLAGIGLSLAAPALMVAGILLSMAAPMFLYGAIGITMGMLFMAAIPSLEVLTVSQQLAQATPLLIGVAFGLLLASPALFVGAIWFMFASMMLAAAAPSFLFAGVLISLGMMMLNGPLMQFASIMLFMAPIVPQMYAIAGALIALGLALPAFGLGLLVLGVLSSIPLVKTGLNLLTRALWRFADAMMFIPTEKAVALGQIFGGLTVLTQFENVGKGMAELAGGIWLLAMAMDSIPEDKLVTMGVAMEALNPMAEVSKSLTPEVAIAAGSLVDEAERYVEVQANMKSAKDDAFAQMVTASARATQARAEADKAATEKNAGQDVVLVLNERELGRAVEAILNKRVNLAIS